MKTRVTSLLMLFALVPFTALPQEKAESGTKARIRKEGMDSSRIMRTMHYLTDVYGPRLTGSPNLKAAGEWAVKEMQSWGLENSHLEPWEFGHPGWASERLAAYIISPVKDSLVCEALAWTPGTAGTVIADACQLDPPEKPTQTELNAYLESVKDKVSGKIVLVGKPQKVSVTIEPPARRLPDDQARNRYDPNNPNAGRFGRPGRQQEEQTDPARLTAAKINRTIDAFLVANKAALRVNDAGRDHGQIRAFSNRTYDPGKVVPTVVMRNEDYGRMSRLLADGIRIQLEFNIVNRFYPEGRTAYNTVAEITGSDKRDEIIMLGGHLDSWHAATGATDNAIGCAIMMEAARILKAIEVKPRRTIRVALWSGEEQGLLGSAAYVKQHFGSFENPKPEFSKLGAYFNIDSGTGRARGFSVFGPGDAAAVLREVANQLGDLGVMGAIASKNRASGGSDHASFTRAGLPGIGVGQDPIEYNSYTWHTNLDTYERIIEDDAKKAAIAIATAVYTLAMRDELLARFSREEMPAPPPAPGEPQAGQPSRPANDR